jgi:hypothetical protein
MCILGMLESEWSSKGAYADGSVVMCRRLLEVFGDQFTILAFPCNQVAIGQLQSRHIDCTKIDHTTHGLIRLLYIWHMHMYIYVHILVDLGHDIQMFAPT